MIYQTKYQVNTNKLFEEIKDLPLSNFDKQFCFTGVVPDDSPYTGSGSLGFKIENGKLIERKNRLYEHQFTYFISKYNNFYVKEIYDMLSKEFVIGRVRLMKMLPKTCLRWHEDMNTRLHIALKTNPYCGFIFNDKVYRIPNDNHVWFVDTRTHHTFFNSGLEDRYHLVMDVLHDNRK